jgi:hypothetical protein
LLEYFFLGIVGEIDKRGADVVYFWPIIHGS